MPWDSTKQVNPGNADGELTATEWNNHVTEGHFPADELNLGVNGDGDPVFTDPQNGDAEVLRYDRSAGQWVLSSLSTDQLSNAGHTTELLENLPGSPPTNEVSFSVDTGTYDGMFLDVELEVQGGATSLELVMASASDGDYDYITQDVTTFTELNDQNGWAISRAGRSGIWQGTAWFIGDGVLVPDGVGQQDTIFQDHLIRGLIDQSPSGEESFTISTNDDLNRIQQVLVSGVIRE